MWAIGGNSGKIAEVTVDGTIVKFGCDRMGNGHFAICLKAACNITGSDFRDRQIALKDDFQITEAVINEFRLPDKWVGISVDIGIFLGDIAVVDIAIDIAEEDFRADMHSPIADCTYDEVDWEEY